MNEKIIDFGNLISTSFSRMFPNKRRTKAKQSVSSENITIKSKRNTDIYATMVIPQETSEEMSLVVMSHGFVDDKVDVAALWAPAANDGLSGLYDFMGGEKAVQEMYNEAKQKGQSTFTLWGEPYVDCSLRFFEENEKSRPLENIGKYQGHLMIAIDEFYDYVSKETTNAVIQSATDIRVIHVKNADHVFDAADGSGSQEPREFLVQKTYEFLIEYLK